MTNDLQETLFNKYPKLFREKDLPPSQTCMCWGFECGDGWFNILDVLCEKINKHCEKNDIDVTVAQVKEKFGGLRFYYNGGDYTVDDLVSFAESLSERTCEICGSPGKMGQTNGWYRTTCEGCNEKRKNLL
jgi:hypothetical protein